MTSSEIQEVKRHFDVVSERLESKISVLAEGLSALDEKVDREAGSLRTQLQAGFAETQAMIKFSYAELDRRVSMLESTLAALGGTVAQLDSRLSRLEK